MNEHHTATLAEPGHERKNVMSIISKTSTGIEVTLTGTEYIGHPTVNVSFSHPKMGKVEFQSSTYGSPKDHKDQKGIMGHWNGKPACVTVPREAFDAAMAEAKAIGEKEITDLKSGVKKIALHYHDGEYLSGNAVSGRAAEMLVSIGMAKDISGWGTIVEDRLVSALGIEFTYADALMFAQPELDAAKAKAEDAKSKLATKIAAAHEEAKKTGEPIAYRSWPDDRNGEDVMVYQYVHPDGTTFERVMECD